MKTIENMEIRLNEGTLLSNSCRMSIVINDEDFYMLVAPTKYDNIDMLVHDIIFKNGAVLSKMAQAYSHLDLSTASKEDLMIHASTYATAIAISLNAEFEAIGVRDIRLSQDVEMDIVAFEHRPDRSESSFSAHCVIIEDHCAAGEMEINFQYDGDQILLTSQSKSAIKDLIEKSNALSATDKDRDPLSSEMFSSGSRDTYSIIIRRLKNDIESLVFS